MQLLNIILAILQSYQQFLGHSYVCDTQNVTRYSRQLPEQLTHSLPTVLVNENVYRIGYRVGDPLDFYELFRSYYNREAARVIITSHIVGPHRSDVRRPNQSFRRDGVITVADENSFKRANVYQRFRRLLGQRQTYISGPEAGVIDRGHLVPSNDFAFHNDMAATFRYINVFPQFASINRGNWRTIENWVRDYADANGVIQIITGTLGVLHLRDVNGNLVPMYLADGNRNPIPMWIFKIVNFLSNLFSETFVFLTYNNIYDRVPPAPPSRVISAPINLRNETSFGFTYILEYAGFRDYLSNYTRHLSKNNYADLNDDL